MAAGVVSLRAARELSACAGRRSTATPPAVARLTEGRPPYPAGFPDFVGRAAHAPVSGFSERREWLVLAHRVGDFALEGAFFLDLADLLA